MNATLTISSLDWTEDDFDSFQGSTTEDRELHTVTMPRLRVSPSRTGTVQVTDLDVASPWLAGELRKLSQMKLLPRQWESSGAQPPNDTAIAHASEVLVALADIDFRPDHLDPSTDEGVCISFRKGNRYADVECFNSGEILAVISEYGGDPQIWEPLEISEAAVRINSFICD